jgi:hypothetical protein
MAYTQQTWTDTVSIANSTTMTHIEKGIADAHAGLRGNPLDGFAGADDDAKLSAAMSYSAAQTYKSPILFDNRLHVFNNGNITPFDGMSFLGTVMQGDSELTSTKRNTVQLNMGTPWLNNAGTIRGVCISGLSFQGSQSNRLTVFWQCTGNAQVCLLRDLSFTGFLGVLGTAATAWVNTGTVLDGYWDTNGSYGTPYHFAGSDSEFWLNGGHLIDSPVTGGSDFATHQPADGTPEIFFDSQSNTVVGPMYITAEGVWRAVLIKANNSVASNSTGDLKFMPGARFEGRNPAQPSHGSLITIQNWAAGNAGPAVTFFGPWISNGMSAPLSGENGMMQINSGRVDLIAPRYQRTNALAESVPLVNVATGQLNISNARGMDRNDGGGGFGWTGQPRVQVGDGLSNPVWAGTTAYTTASKVQQSYLALSGRAGGALWTYQPTVGGTSGGSEPAWPEQWGATVTDGSVTWQQRTKIVWDASVTVGA